MPRLGIALSGHHLRLDSITRLARQADRLGYDPVLIDGDTACVPGRPDAPIYEGLTLSGIVLERTQQARVGSIRLPFFWNPVLLARGLATLQEASGGRALAIFGLGGRDTRRIGLPPAGPGERIDWTEEVLDALAPLLRGERVTRHGRFVDLEGVQLPPLTHPPPIVVAASGPRALAIVDAHAEVWDANVPPLIEEIEWRRARLKRDLETWIWVFARPQDPFEEAASAYRRHCPWFSSVRDDLLPRALLFGDLDRCRDRLAAVREELRGTPILDPIGLGEIELARVLDGLAPAKDDAIS
ncbi:MAG: LLM class flavin-dependent oxidoreductase [Myxococcota bacterium]